MFQKNSFGALVLNDFLAIFFQKNQSPVGREVTNFVMEVLNKNGSLEHVNDTFITLISKIQKAKRVGEFKPISLCNVIYKVVAKTLANRLKLFLPEIISPTQSIAYEARHSMSTILRGNDRYMAIKLDMSKAYDKIEWEFLQAFMVKLGFSQRQIQLIMSFVSSMSYSILVNGQPQLFSKPSRGLRQRDPLSPYQFILCA